MCDPRPDTEQLLMSVIKIVTKFHSINYLLLETNLYLQYIVMYNTSVFYIKHLKHSYPYMTATMIEIVFC